MAEIKAWKVAYKHLIYFLEKPYGHLPPIMKIIP